MQGIDVQQMRERAREIRESVTWEIGPQRVLFYARGSLGDLEQFSIQMGQWLGQESYPTQEQAG